MSEEVSRIQNMDEKQVLLKVRNFKYMRHITKEEFEEQKTALRNKLNEYGYELTNACCGRYSAHKRVEK